MQEAISCEFLRALAFQFTESKYTIQIGSGFHSKNTIAKAREIFWLESDFRIDCSSALHIERPVDNELIFETDYNEDNTRFV